MGAKQFKLDDSVVNEIIVAVKETFFHSLAEEIEFVSTEDKASMTYDLYGIVGLEQIDSENQSIGVLKCEFKKDFIFYVLKKLYRSEINDIDRSTIHCAGEFTNIIYTRIKSNLNEKLGYSFKMAVPAVALAHDDEMFPLSKEPCIDKAINFKFQDVPFCVHLKVRVNK